MPAVAAFLAHVAFCALILYGYVGWRVEDEGHHGVRLGVARWTGGVALTTRVAPDNRVRNVYIVIWFAAGLVRQRVSQTRVMQQ